MRKNAEAANILQPGESIQQIFGAQTTSAYLGGLSPLMMLFINGYRVVVVTDKRIIVTKSGRLTTTPVKGVDRELPRSFKFGEPNGLWHKFDANGQTLHVARRFFKDMEAADAAA
jgi:hypothetical protein